MKRITNILAAIILAFLSTNPVLATENEYNGKNDNFISNVIIKAYDENLETGEVVVKELKNDDVTINISEVTDDGEIILSSTYSTFFAIPNENQVDPQASGGGHKTEAGVTAYITVYYTDVRSDGSFKVTGFSGGWTPSANYYVITGRSCGCKDNVLYHATYQYPTSNTYSYTVNWGYVPRVWNSNTGPSGWSDATVTPTGMSSHHISLDVNV